MPASVTDQRPLSPYMSFSAPVIVPLKQGNASRADLGEGRRCLIVELSVAHSAGTSSLETAVNGKLTDSVAACKTTVRRTGCLNWARPDLWERWEVTPTATRPLYVHFCHLFRANKPRRANARRKPWGCCNGGRRWPICGRVRWANGRCGNWRTCRECKRFVGPWFRLGNFRMISSGCAPRPWRAIAVVRCWAQGRGMSMRNRDGSQSMTELLKRHPPFFFLVGGCCLFCWMGR
jgi:hypothetical protein